MGRMFVFDDSSESSSSEVKETKYELPEKKKNVTLIICICIGVLIVIAAVCLFFAFKEKHEDEQIDDMWDNVRTVADNVSLGNTDIPSDDDHVYVDVTENPSDEEDLPVVSENVISENVVRDDDPMKRIIDWEALFAINKDVCGWVYIPGTKVDYPILQEQEFGKSFYLNHNIYKVSQKSGAIFTPAQLNEHVDDAHMLLYGHHMKSLSMFGSITQYKKEDYYKAHPSIYIYRPGYVDRYDIFSMEHVKDDHSVYLIPYTIKTVEYGELLKKLQDESVNKTSVTDITSNDRIVVLSTCDHTDSSSTGRFIVSGVLRKSIKIMKSDEVLLQTDFEGDDSIVIEDSEYEGYDVTGDDANLLTRDSVDAVFFDQD